jgi:endonuclease G
MQQPTDQQVTPTISQPVTTTYQANDIQKEYKDAGLTELTITTDGVKEQIIEHMAYTVSYNSTWNEPNWVAWELTREECSAQRGRNQDFEPDPQVKGKRITTHDYSRSGYTRGHMAPAGDMKWSEKAMNECFYTSNICPQDKELNAGLWEDVESRSRYWAKRYGKLWICCGPIVQDLHKNVKNKIAVPSHFFKVVCTEDKGKYYAMGFVFPNENCKGDIWKYAYSVDEIEELTGHDFFHNLPDNIENRIESDEQFQFWRRRPRN